MGELKDKAKGMANEVAGNVKQQSLSDIFLGPAYERLRQGMNRTRLAVCATCDQYLKENRLVRDKLNQQAMPKHFLIPLEVVA